MEQLRFFVSLITKENDYQREQLAAAEAVGARDGHEIVAVFAEKGAVAQNAQISEALRSENRFHGAVVEPIGSGITAHAEAAVRANIGWAILHNSAPYLTNLRHKDGPPVFVVNADHEEIGRIQSQQLHALLPHGGTVLCIQGPIGCEPADKRLQGMMRSKPDNVRIFLLRGQWTEASGYEAVKAWLGAVRGGGDLAAIVGQCDLMAMGARRAIEELPKNDSRRRWLDNLLFLGVDGLPHGGREWVRKGLLVATVIMQPNAGRAIELLANAIKTRAHPPAQVTIPSESLPPVEQLVAAGRNSGSAASC